MLMKVYNGIGLIALKTNATLVPIIFTGLKYSKLSRVTDKFKAHFFHKLVCTSVILLNLILVKLKVFVCKKRNQQSNFTSITKIIINISPIK